MNATNIQPYSRAVVKLLKGIVEKDDVVWNDVLDYQSEILDYISVMGLELIVKKDEGFAFVKQLKLDDDKTLNMTSRRLYGFEVSVILIVLRQILEDFDSNPTESQASYKYVTATEIKEEADCSCPPPSIVPSLRKTLTAISTASSALVSLWKQSMLRARNAIKYIASSRRR